MDPLTHALASYALKRAAFPRLARRATAAMILAGTLADLDPLSRYFGPSAYLTWNRTYTHSVFAAVLFSLLAAFPFSFLRRAPELRISPASVFLPVLVASLLHLLLDVCQSQGPGLFWPISRRRFALDWLPSLDFWIFGLLLAAILLPNLASLVTEEIGARSKVPRGRLGALVALAAVLLYIGARAILHSSAVATLDSRTYRSESPRRVAAFPTAASPFVWTGVVETERALHEATVSVASGSSFDSDSAHTSYKPDPSPALEAALRTTAAHRFLAATRFPKASLGRTTEGFRVQLWAFPNLSREASPLVFAVIDTDANSKILSEDILWDPASQQIWWR